MYCTNWTAAFGCSTKVVHQFAKCDAECGFHNSATSNVAGKLEHLRSATAAHAKRCICCCAIGEDCWDCAERQHVVHHGWFSEQTNKCRNWWLRSNNTALAFEAFDQCSFFAANVCTCTNTNVNGECETRTQHIAAEPTLFRCCINCFIQRFDCFWVFTAHIDVTSVCANSPASNGHAFKQHERIAFHQHAVGKRSAVTFVCIAHDVLRGAWRFKNRAPFNSGWECGAAATTKAAISNFGNNITWRHAKCALQTFNATVCFVVLRRTRVNNTNTLISHTLLTLDPRKLGGQTKSKWVSATIQNIGAQQTGNVVNKYWTVSNATFLGCNFDHWLEPHHAP